MLSDGLVTASRGAARTRIGFAGVALLASLPACGRVEGERWLTWNHAEPAPPSATSGVSDADTAFTRPVSSFPPEKSRPVLEPVVLSVLLVYVPLDQHASAELIWRHLREDLPGAEAGLRLRRNGIRFGVGQDRSWDAIWAAIEAIQDRRTSETSRVLLRPGFPLALELDSRPREQTIFCLGPDGALSGGTWRDGRNVLLIQHAADVQRPERVHLLIVPTLVQESAETRWTRDAQGAWQLAPGRVQRAFPAVSFAAALDPGEFLLIAPSAEARISGLIGREFLIRESDGRLFGLFLFIRPEVMRVAERN
jgi:hypothetical protein